MMLEDNCTCGLIICLRVRLDPITILIITEQLGNKQKLFHLSLVIQIFNMYPHILKQGFIVME